MQDKEAAREEEKKKELEALKEEKKEDNEVKKRTLDENLISLYPANVILSL